MYLRDKSQTVFSLSSECQLIRVEPKRLLYRPGLDGVRDRGCDRPPRPLRVPRHHLVVRLQKAENVFQR